MEQLYLELLKKSLLGDLYYENELRLLYLRACIEGRDSYDPRTLLRITEERRAFCEQWRELNRYGRFIDDRLEHLGFQHTMIGRARLENVADCLESIRRDNVPGDLMECGVWRGGTTVFMRGFLEAFDIRDRAVWVADSFAGLPPPSLPQDEGYDLSATRFPMLAISLETVQDVFARYGLLDEQVRFLPGWFKDTLPRAPVERLALLRLDGDLYESTWDALSALYSRLSPGGFLIVDDYHCIPACRQAVDDYRSRERIAEPIEPIDWSGVYWRKAFTSTPTRSDRQELRAPGSNEPIPGRAGSSLSPGARPRAERPAPRPEAIVTFPEAIAQAVAHHQAGQWAEAEEIYRSVLRARPNHFDALHMSGVLEAQRGRLAEADRLLRHALSIDGQSPDALSNHGNVQRALGFREQALASYDKALATRPEYVEALNNRGVVLHELGRHDEALTSYDRALAIKPDYADALGNRGNALRVLQRHAEALASFEAALAIAPNHAETLNNRGATFEAMNRYDAALASYDQALAIRPDYRDAWNNRGVVLEELLRHEEALACYDKALALDPDDENALANRGHTLLDLKRYEEAIRDFERVLELRPEALLAKGLLLHARMLCCDWREYGEASRALIADVRSGRPVTVPFAFLGVADSAIDQLRCAETWIRGHSPPSNAPLWTGERYEHGRIRLAYVAADFHDHATARLTAGLFERHDRARFATTAVSLGPDVPGAMRARLEGAFDRFIDVRQGSSDEVAGLLRRMEIDIAIDLTGHARGCRTGIFARRPAPVQVNYLGYPGTMGASYFDYILADRFVIPPACRSRYAENVVYLPDTFQANDLERPVAQHTPTRAEAGLPETGFVFCSFNSSFKITPSMFDVWTRLLRRIEGSVLWLLGENPAVATNLRREAAARGLEPKRLVFAERLPYEDYLARYRLADLFLDTLPFNAGTTASDALWVGVPLLTCAGEAFAARMAGSLLNAVGLNDLVARSVDEYEARGFELATQPGLLAEVRRRLARNRGSHPLFDTDRFRRHIEAAYVEMRERSRRGEPPAGFDVATIA